jgi:hypothetical protein
MAWKKPQWVQKVQSSAQKAADTVAKAPTPVLQKVQAAAQKATNAVGDVVRPAAQAVAKEVGSVVNPVLGEIKYRADEAGKNKTIQNIGNKIKEGVNTAQASANEAGAPLPFFTQVVPSAIRDTVYGVGDTLAGDVGKGLSKVGNSALDVAKHAAMGTLGVFGNYRGGGDNFSGRSGGAATNEIPRPGEDTNDVPPPGAGKNPIGSSTVPNGGRPIPPVPTTGGSFLTGPQSKQASPQMNQLKELQKRMKSRFKPL